MPHYKFNCEICGKERETYRSPSKPAPKRCLGCSPGRPRPLTQEQESFLREAYTTCVNATEALDQCLQKPLFSKINRNQLKGWAIRLGLTRIRNADRKWKPNELKRVEELIGYHPKKIREILAKEGIVYSEGSIARQIRLMGSNPVVDGFTPQELGEVLGVHRMTVQRWIKQGKIKTECYNEGGIHSGVRQWVTPRNLVKFLRTYPELVSGKFLDFPLILSLLDEFSHQKRKREKNKNEMF